MVKRKAEDEVEVKLEFPWYEDNDKNIPGIGTSYELKEERWEKDDWEPLLKHVLPYSFPSHHKTKMVHKKVADIATIVTGRNSPPCFGGVTPITSLKLFYRINGENELLEFPDIDTSKLITVGKLQPKNFIIDLNLDNLGIVGTLEQYLRAGEFKQSNTDYLRHRNLLPKLVPQLEELCVKGPGTHVVLNESQGVEGVEGTLLVFLPSSYTGGEVSVMRDGKEVQVFDYGDKLLDASKIYWLCYSEGCTHVIKDVTGGCQLILSYKLKRCEDPKVEVSFPKEMEDMVREALGTQEFYPNGALLAFPCQHLYPILQEHTLGVLDDFTLMSPNELAMVLRGSDAELFHSAVAAGLNVQVRPVWEGDFVGKYAHGLVVSKQTYYSFGDEEQQSFLDMFPRRHLVWCHDKGHWLEGMGAWNMYDHKRGGIDYIKQTLAILVSIPPWKSRRGSYGKELGSSSNQESVGPRRSGRLAKNK